jgi:sRNA-binding carbon storage regulator CsrA
MSMQRPAGMLAIKRKVHESVILQLANGETIIVKSLPGNRLGISAPQHVRVLRDEHLMQGQDLAEFRRKGLSNG